jgi:signal transduction histidine kinase
VTIAVVDGVIEATVADNGVGFDVDRLPHESGLATMRTFASYCDGTVEVESIRGQGTAVTARLGARVPGGPEPRPPRLRLIEGGREVQTADARPGVR